MVVSANDTLLQPTNTENVSYALTFESGYGSYDNIVFLFVCLFVCLFWLFVCLLDCLLTWLSLPIGGGGRCY